VVPDATATARGALVLAHDRPVVTVQVARIEAAATIGNQSVNLPGPELPVMETSS
jgi:hypothetical protein